MTKPKHPRGRALRWLTNHRGCTEQPPGSNRDNRRDGITAAQRRLGDWLVGLAWCGVWFANALLAANVKGVTYRLASVTNIEDDARAGRAPFRRWIEPTGKWWKWVLRGDGVVLFGRGYHVETVRSTWTRIFGYIWTEGGNTTAEGQAGSQSNGGTSAKRRRYLHQIHGFACVDYPNG